MVKERSKPSRSMSRRRIRTQAEWKVAAQTSLASGPRRRSRRSFSSPAALFVKVMARMLQGMAGSRRHSRRARSRSSPSASAGQPSKKARSSGVTQAGTSSLSAPRPYSMRLATRWMSTVVFPLPAPASSSKGPSVARAALRCIGFRLKNCPSINARRALQNRTSSSCVSMVSPQVSVFRFYCTEKPPPGQPFPGKASRHQRSTQKSSS